MVGDNMHTFFFNQSSNDAKLGKDDFVDMFSIQEFNKEIQPFINKGVMSIFNVKPNKYTLFYVKKVSIYAKDREHRQDTAYRKFDFSKGSNAESLKPVRLFGVREEIRKLDALYNHLKKKGYKPRIYEVSDVGNFYSIEISLPYTHRQLRTSQQVFFNLGFGSATYRPNEKIKVGLFVQKKR